mmetsp:Transcript_3839/g.9008  ORF Transcript_3839/g.9008 Transcript_3839/m.9008 type:complete len:123 (-) Transcript_3839:107-475(-)
MSTCKSHPTCPILQPTKKRGTDRLEVAARWGVAKTFMQASQELFNLSGVAPMKPAPDQHKLEEGEAWIQNYREVKISGRRPRRFSSLLLMLRSCIRSFVVEIPKVGEAAAEGTTLPVLQRLL